MPTPEAELAAAAAVFDEELAAYARLGERFVTAPLSSVKYLERANATLSELAACEGRLQAAGQRMVEALSAARARQEELARQVVAHVPRVQERNQQLSELMSELTGVAGEVGQLNAAIVGHRENGEPTQQPSAEDARGLSATVFALSERAERLAVTAREAELEELATQAHALHQRLVALGTKLQKVGGA